MPDVTTTPAAKPPPAAAGARADGRVGAAGPKLFALLLPTSPPSQSARHDDAAPGKPLPDAEDAALDAPLIAYGQGQPAPAIAPIFTGTVETAVPTAPILAAGRDRSAPLDQPTPTGAPVSRPGADVDDKLVSPDPVVARASTPPLRDAAIPMVATFPLAAAASTDRMASGQRIASPDPRPVDGSTTPLPPHPELLAAQPAAEPRVGRASEVFARALATITRPLRRRDEDQAPQLGEPTPATDLVAIADAATAAKAVVPTDRALHAMIDRIDRLRDDANASDTRIRLKPEALGTIDIGLRREGESVHLHFAAAVPETRTMIADAQPRLEAIAAERGLALAGTSVGDDRARPHALRPGPAMPRAPKGAAGDPIDDPVIDIRIA